MDPSAPPIRLVAGLGNPEPRYASTRHNAGQRAVELLASRLGAGRWVARYGGRYAEARGPSGPVGLLIPTTYMNASGDAVGPAAGSLHAAPAQVLLVHDEVDLPFGAVRGKTGGGAGGHNGLRSVIRGLGTGEFPRIRLGPPEEVEAMGARGADMAEVARAEGIDAAVNRFHASPPGARARARRERRDGAEGETSDEAPE